MGFIRPVLAGDFEELILSPINKFKSDLPRLAMNSNLTGGGAVFDCSMNKFVLHGTTIASFFVNKGNEAIAVSDGKVSEGPLLNAASLEFQKLIELDRSTIMGMSGSAGFALLYARVLKNWIETTERIREEQLDTRSKVNMMAKILRDNLSLALSGFLVIPILTTCDDKHGPRIFYFSAEGSIVAKKTYAISGSGRVNEGGLLQQWRIDMSRDEGIELAKNLVQNAHFLDNATGGRIFIKIISRDGIESVDGGWTNE